MAQGLFADNQSKGGIRRQQGMGPRDRGGRPTTPGVSGEACATARSALV